MSNKKIRLAVVDDHVLFRKGLIRIIQQIDERFVIADEFDNGLVFLNWLNEGHEVDIVILDVNMPVMDGFDTAERLKTRPNSPRILSLTMLDDDPTLIRLLRLGVSGFLNKDVEPLVLKEALLKIAAEGRYYTEQLAGKLVEVITEEEEVEDPRLHNITDREFAFIQYCCTELTYKEIAERMNVSPSTVEGYRKELFEKLHLKSRVGLVIYALKKELVILEDLD